MCSTKPPTRNRWPVWEPRRSAPSCGAAAPLSATQATPGPTSSGTADSPSSPTTTPTCRSWWTAAPSPPRKPSITPRRTSSPGRWAWTTASTPSSPACRCRRAICSCSAPTASPTSCPRKTIEEIFTKGGFYDIPDRLVDAANAGGGPDNITALLLGVEPLEVKHG